MTAQHLRPLEQITGIFHWAGEECKISLLASKKIVKTLNFDGHTWQVGWVHDPLRMTRHRLALGIFTEKNMFVPVAVADSHGRIYEAGKIEADLAGIDPRVQLMSGGTGQVHYYRFARTDKTSAANNEIDVFHGSVIARSEDGNLRWLSSWLKYNGRYTFEQVRSTALSRVETAQLHYRDAMVIAYFVMYVQPTLALHGRVFGFGTSNIYRRLRNQAPLSAIRTSVADIEAARAQNLRVSGLEEYFAHIMREAGALDHIRQLEAKHGKENLELMTNPQSHLYYLHSRDGVDFDAALTTLRIEASLNRFSAVSSVIENNYHYDFEPTEDFISLPYVAKLSDDLLENPAFDALSTLETNGVKNSEALAALRYVAQDETPTQETSFSSNWLGQFYAQARKNGATRLDNVAHINAAFPLVYAARETAAALAKMNEPYDEDARYTSENAAGRSEWLYRQTMAQLITHVRLPLRSDIDFRSDLSEGAGRVAIDFTSSAETVMPAHTYDSQQLQWVDLPERERKSQASRYNQRVGIMLAAFAFGASSAVNEVALRIDNLYSAQDIEDRDPVIYSLLMRALNSMGMELGNRQQNNDAYPGDGNGNKADPKDGDVHGAPAGSVLSSVTGADTSSPQTAQTLPSQAASSSPTGVSDGTSTGSAVEDDFVSLMNSVGFTPEQLEAFNAMEASSDRSKKLDNQPSDEEVDAAFNAVTHSGQEEQHKLVGDSQRIRVMSGPGTDPLDLLRRTALTNTVATVIFTRDEFLKLLERDGLYNPYDFYHHFDAELFPDENGILQAIDAKKDMRDSRYTHQGAHEEPELSDKKLDPAASRILGTDSVRGLSIQRNDVLEGAQADIVGIAHDETLNVAGRAEKIAQYIDALADPELSQRKESYTRSVIDGSEIDRSRFTLADDFEKARIQSRDTFMQGDPQGAFDLIENKFAELDSAFSSAGRVPVYFNSYAERVVYNKLFATPGEKLVLIPDNLFQTHMEMVEVYSHVGKPDDVLRHLNTAVAYAPAYPLPHLRLAVMLAEQGDWQSSFAAASNALRVALDKDDAAYAYYRMAYAAWMQDQFDIAAACYVIAIRISVRTIPHALEELEELTNRARSQDIPLPLDFNEAVDALAYYDIDFWPHTQAASMMDVSAKTAVDNYLFVAGRTLSVAAARIASASASMDNDDDLDAREIVQFQFMRSLNA